MIEIDNESQSYGNAYLKIEIFEGSLKLRIVFNIILSNNTYDNFKFNEL